MAGDRRDGDPAAARDRSGAARPVRGDPAAVGRTDRGGAVPQLRNRWGQCLDAGGVLRPADRPFGA